MFSLKNVLSCIEACEVQDVSRETFNCAKCNDTGIVGDDDTAYICGCSAGATYAETEEEIFMNGCYCEGLGIMPHSDDSSENAEFCLWCQAGKDLAKLYNVEHLAHNDNEELYDEYEQRQANKAFINAKHSPKSYFYNQQILLKEKLIEEQRVLSEAKLKQGIIELSQLIAKSKKELDELMVDYADSSPNGIERDRRLDVMSKKNININELLR